MPHNELTTQMQQLEATQICCLRVSECQESEGGLVGWIWPSASDEVAVQISARAAVIRSGNWLEDLLPGSPLGLCPSSSVTQHVDISIRLPTARPLASLEARDCRPRESNQEGSHLTLSFETCVFGTSSHRVRNPATLKPPGW